MYGKLLMKLCNGSYFFRFGEVAMKNQVVLLIHGFGGSIEEIRYLKDYLNKRNIKTISFTLAGHGQDKATLKNTTYKDWINSVKQQIKRLRYEYKNITLIGFSMGGLLAMQFAKCKEIEKIIFINTPIYFWNIKVIAKDVAKCFKNKNFKPLKYYSNSVSNISIKSGIDFLKLLNTSKKIDAKIKQPALVLQCENDESVKPKSAEFIKHRLCQNATVKYFDNGRHQIFEDLKLRDKATKEVYCFLK